MAYMKTVDTNIPNVAIILAAGGGTRFGRKKQFVRVNDMELWEYSYKTVLKVIPQPNIVVVGVDIPGGATRACSVKCGLDYFFGKGGWYNKVLIVEAARPLVTAEQLRRLLMFEDKSVTFVLPLVNTVIGRSGKYFDRDDFYDLLTPQAFDFTLLHKAYQGGPNMNFTDETRLMYETYKIKPTFVEGGSNLIKVTYPEDLELFQVLLKEKND